MISVTRSSPCRFARFKETLRLTHSDASLDHAEHRLKKRQSEYAPNSICVIVDSPRALNPRGRSSELPIPRADLVN